MKKLILLISFNAVICAHEFTKHDLEKAIRVVDVALVRQIIANIVLTPHEHRAFLALAGEVICENEIRILKGDSLQSSEYVEAINLVPYDGPSQDWVAAEAVFSCIGIWGGITSFIFSTGGMSEVRHKLKALSLGSFVLGIVLLCKFGFDKIKVKAALKKQRDLQRKKHDDAVTIKHLIYMAPIADSM